VGGHSSGRFFDIFGRFLANFDQFFREDGSKHIYTMKALTIQYLHTLFLNNSSFATIADKMLILFFKPKSCFFFQKVGTEIDFGKHFYINNNFVYVFFLLFFFGKNYKHFLDCRSNNS